MAGLFALLFLASCSLSLAFSPAVPLQLRVKSHAVSAIPSLRVSQSNILPAYSLGHRFRTVLASSVSLSCIIALCWTGGEGDSGEGGERERARDGRGERRKEMVATV
eukprot:1849622-Rhodomonas_salina.3